MGGGLQHNPKKCDMCYLKDHSTDSCPWIYTSCKNPDCDGIMKLLTSNTPANPNRMYLKCHVIECNSFQWLSDAVDKDKEVVGSSSNTGCYGCGGFGHWVKDCQWKARSCDVQGCGGVMKLLISKEKMSYGEKFLKCLTCNNFQWLKDAQIEAQKKTDVRNINISLQMTMEMGLDAFCNEFKGKTTMK
ncbi:hypothetical protein GIB67_014869 [Kingdonia uniflora]|uniref:CCHC-type domain-containing protein n=1 Tax=Kingdonia uniflora TaxID=39325 RepID=A0A7J7MT39_9MAGN|nr:hypothetical protein GIB67_014869 [Kingdonia uniflora]